MTLPREILLLLIRHALSAVGLLLMAKGVLTQDDADAFADLGSQALGLIIAIAGLGWSAKRKVDRARRAEPAHNPKLPLLLILCATLPLLACGCAATGPRTESEALIYHAAGQAALDAFRSAAP